MATLAANRQWWAHGPLLSYGQRVEIAGSEIVWEYYPGQGIQIQVLGSFSKADALYTAGAASYPEMEKVLAQLIPLAAQRGGGLAWEYYFSFDGGSPPWTSAMSQATALEALARAYQATKDPTYLNVASPGDADLHQAPAGRASTSRPRRRHALPAVHLRSRLSIINAFLQTLIGLYDFGQVSGNAAAKRLFARGNAEAQLEVPAVRHRRLVALPARRRGQPGLPRAGHRLPAAAVHPHAARPCTARPPSTSRRT